MQPWATQVHVTNNSTKITKVGVLIIIEWQNKKIKRKMDACLKGVNVGNTFITFLWEKKRKEKELAFLTTFYISHEPS